MSQQPGEVFIRSVTALDGAGGKHVLFVYALPQPSTAFSLKIHTHFRIEDFAGRPVIDLNNGALQIEGGPVVQPIGPAES